MTLFCLKCHSSLFSFVGATLNLGHAGERNVQFSNLTVQDGGVLEFHSDYNDIADRWTLQVTI